MAVTDWAVTFDLFGTLLEVEPPADPAAAVARALREREVAVPADWGDAYAEWHVDVPDGAEVPLPEHVSAALRSRGVAAAPSTVHSAVAAAFDPVVDPRESASDAVAAAAARGPVGILSNCSIPGLAARALRRAEIEPGAFDAVVTSVGCGWRKPHARAFEAVAEELGVAVDALAHVGDDPATDGGIATLGGRFLDVTETPLESLTAQLRDGTLGGEGGSLCP
ncbi:HAD family hydrolase [Halobellus sp. GM3]|uniref:HAD family hydrolase n=1 Tax=Halobellus sp. GM3 TaxID=3458410 RepID=UPI00403DA19F